MISSDVQGVSSFVCARHVKRICFVLLAMVCSMPSVAIVQPEYPEHEGIGTPFEITGQIRRLMTSDNLLIVGAEEITIFDISDPDAPRKISSLAIPNYSDLGMVGSDLAVATESGDLVVFAIPATGAPRELSRLACGTPPIGFDTQDALVCVTNKDAKLALVDLHDRAHPALVAETDLVGPADDVIVARSLVYPKGLRCAVDISSPTSPRLAAIATRSWTEDGESIEWPKGTIWRALAHFGESLVLLEKLPYGNVMRAYHADYKYPNVTLMPLTIHAPDNFFDWPVSFQSQDNLGASVSWAGVFTTYRVYEDAEPQLLAARQLGQSWGGLAVRGDHAFVGDMLGVHVFDIADPKKPLETHLLPRASTPDERELTKSLVCFQTHYRDARPAIMALGWLPSPKSETGDGSGCDSIREEGLPECDSCAQSLGGCHFIWGRAGSKMQLHVKISPCLEDCDWLVSDWWIQEGD